MSSHIIVGPPITDTVFGTNGNDIMGGDGIFYGLWGNDSIGFSGTAYGGAGDDSLSAQLGSGDVGYGGLGDDVLEGYYHSSPTFYGGAGNDTFKFVQGSELFGGGGDDLFLINDRDNTITGGAGADVFQIISRPIDYDGEVTNLTGTVITDFQIGTDKIELGTSEFHTHSRLTWDDITLVAEGSDTRVIGLGTSSSQKIDLLLKDVDMSNLSETDFIVANKDTLTGTDGQDYLLGSRATDIIRGGADQDWIFGLEGDDRLRGGSGRDSITGDEGDDRLHGGRGRDTLDGGDGNDILRGGRGNDLLTDGAGHDRLFGGDGDDRLVGGSGWDQYTGGTGADTFVFTNSGAWRERVMDFEVGADRLEIWGAKAFDDLAFKEMSLAQGDGVIVNYGDGSIFLVGVTLAEINDADNFEFG